ncbi:unnamed protein product [Linum trigynum]|uniref:SNRNP25 ubiquitin-like domain-containing protein n=1 Tax=Linum trigynum TaxID=586398 RepID=A0AAV2DNF6_9ROSI
MSLVDTRIDLGTIDVRPGPEFIHRRSNSLPFLSLYGFSDQGSFSYSKLPARPITLSVLKLDGSCFDIEVKNSATVGELKQAVEAAFSYMPQKGPGKISWPHVWGHFCLGFHGQKLLSEADSISYFGIREGDQLQFIRHLSTTSDSFTKKGSFKRVLTSERNKIEMENGTYVHKDESDLGMIELQEVTDHTSLMSPWFPYSRLSPREKKRKFKVSHSRYGCGFFSGIKNVVQFCGSRC